MPNPTYDKMKELLKDIESSIREEEKKAQDITNMACAYMKIKRAFRNAYPKGL